MNIGFHVIRTPVMKLYGPIIEHLLNAGLRVTIFCDQRVSPMKLGKKKSYQFPAVEEIPVFKGLVEVLAFRSDEELARLVRERDVRAVFFINFSDGNLCRYLKDINSTSKKEIIAYLKKIDL